MNPDKVISFLKEHITKTTAFTDSEISVVESFFVNEVFSKKTFIIKENDKVGYVYFIVSGLVKQSYKDT